MKTPPDLIVESEGDYIPHEEIDAYEDYTEFPLFSILAVLSIPVLGSLSVIVGAEHQRQDGSGASWVASGLIMIILYLLGSMLISFILALLSRARKERFRFLRFIVYGLCGLPLLLAAFSHYDENIE